jgi:hypothetical protein
MPKNMKMLFSSQINNCPDGIISKLRTYLYVDIAAFLLARRHTAPKLAPVFLKGIEWNRNWAKDIIGPAKFLRHV